MVVNWSAGLSLLIFKLCNSPNQTTHFKTSFSSSGFPVWGTYTVRTFNRPLSIWPTLLSLPFHCAFQQFMAALCFICVLYVVRICYATHQCWVVTAFKPVMFAFCILMWMSAGLWLLIISFAVCLLFMAAFCFIYVCYNNTSFRATVQYLLLTSQPGMY